MQLFNMKNIDVRQRSGEWLAWRADGVTASDMPIILGMSPYKTPWQLWAEKTGRINPSDLSNNPNVRRGVLLEDKIRQITEDKIRKITEDEIGSILLPVCGECGDYPILRASFDGLDENNKVFEFKCPSEKVFDDVLQNGCESEAFKLYQIQVLTQCLVAGNENGVLIFYFEGKEPISFEVLLTEQWRDKIISAAHDFWGCVINDKAPVLDFERDFYIPTFGSPSFIWQSEAERWLTLESEMKSLKEKLTEIETAEKAVETKLVGQMGEFRLADFCGVKITRFEKKGSIDYNKFIKDTFADEDKSEELEKFRKKSSFGQRFTKSSDELVNIDENNIMLTEETNAYF